MVLSIAQEQPGQGNDASSRDPGMQSKQGLEATGKASLIIDGNVGILDVVGAIEKINQGLGSISSRIEALDSSLRSIRDNVDTIPAMRHELEAVKKEASISRLIGIVGLWKLSLCVNQRSGVCYAWKLGDNVHELLAIYGDQAVVETDGARRVRVAVAYHLCGICPLFRPRTQ